MKESNYNHMKIPVNNILKNKEKNYYLREYNEKIPENKINIDNSPKNKIKKKNIYLNQLNTYQNDINRNYTSNNYFKIDNRKINHNEINNNTNERSLHISKRKESFGRHAYYSYFNNYTEIPSDNINPENNINNNSNINNIYNDIQQVFNRNIEIKKDSNTQTRINASPIDTPKEDKVVKPKISFNNIKRYNTSMNDSNIQNSKKVVVMKIIKNDTLNQIKNNNKDSNNNNNEDNINLTNKMKPNTYKDNLTNTEFREKRKNIKFNDNRIIDKKLKYNYSEKFQNEKNELLSRNFQSDYLNYPYNKSFTNIMIHNKNNKYDLTKSTDIIHYPKNNENIYGHIKNNKVIYRRKNSNTFKKLLDITPSPTNNRKDKNYNLHL